MKIKLRYTLMLVFLLAGLSTNAQETDKKQPKVTTVVIQTSAECGECKERLEGHLNYTKGVVFSELDLETMQLTVKYKTSVISADVIKKEVSGLGYDADEVKADPKAYDELPSCCKAGGMERK